MKTTATKPENRNPKDVWSLRGVPHDAREAAARAARGANMTLGEWVGRAVHEAAIGEIKGSRAVGKTGEQLAADVLDQMKAFTEAQEQRSQEQIAGLQKLTTRLDALEQERRRGFFERLFGGTGQKRGPVNQSLPIPHS